MFIRSIPSKLERQCKKDVYFSFNFGSVGIPRTGEGGGYLMDKIY